MKGMGKHLIRKNIYVPVIHGKESIKGCLWLKMGPIPVLRRFSTKIGSVPCFEMQIQVRREIHIRCTSSCSVGAPVTSPVCLSISLSLIIPNRFTSLGFCELK